ncbi:unnamed protein product [Protopolystoma xenopodis]|uniref:Uncharacterized protein n=1 Tax=Protopolystoma xenopodis TaxID=117903 RepID=A0A448WL65_9PLAT|nr:unnamed protein product [Protopolystoma xenopodis]
MSPKLRLRQKLRPSPSSGRPRFLQETAFSVPSLLRPHGNTCRLSEQMLSYPFCKKKPSIRTFSLDEPQPSRLVSCPNQRLACRVNAETSTLG